jgi:TetR/AcrR family transcriptional repressor of mexJK operon
VMDVSDPERAADHYFSLLRGMMEFRLSINIEKPPTDAELRRHVEGCVDLFLRAYGSAK